MQQLRRCKHFCKLLRLIGANSLETPCIGCGRVLGHDVYDYGLAYCGPTNLDELVNKNPTMFKMLHPNEAERKAVVQLLNDVKRIKSVKPGSKNYSNTAYTVLNVIRGISPSTQAVSLPFMGSVGKNIEDIAKAGATQELTESLRPVLQQTIDELSGQGFNFSEKFGRKAIVFAFPQTQRNEENKGLEITVNMPRD
jgi:hypothetical protein